MTTDQQIGELIGTVGGLTKAFENMQKSQETSRIEFMGVFKDMRSSMKEVSASLQQHIKDDDAMRAEVSALKTWKNGDGDTRSGAAKQINTLWDERAQTQGILSASRVAGGAFWAMLVLALSYFLPGHGK